MAPGSDTMLPSCSVLPPAPFHLDFFLSSGPQLFIGPLQREHSITFTAGVMPLGLQRQEPDFHLTTDQPPSCPFFSPFFTCRSQLLVSPALR